MLPLPDVSRLYSFAWLPDPCYQAILLFSAVLGLHCCVGFSTLQRVGTTLAAAQWLLMSQSTGCRVHGLQCLQHVASVAADLGSRAQA